MGQRLTKCCLFDSRLHASGKLLVLVVSQCDRNDGRRNISHGIDDLLDTWHALRDVHRSNTGKVECLKRHLR